ncbi:MAG: transposase [Singulisphaera sp.]|nr:transposase [Singulisphaera sp.]
MTAWLTLQGEEINRNRVQRLMRKMGLKAIDPKPRLSAAGRGYKILHPYELHSCSPLSTRCRGGWVCMAAWVTKRQPVCSISTTHLTTNCVTGRFPKSGCLFRDRIPYPSDDKLDIPARLPATASQPCRYVSSPEPVLSCRPRMICSVPLASRPRPLNSSGRSDWRTTPPVSPGWRSRSTTTSVAWPT